MAKKSRKLEELPKNYFNLKGKNAERMVHNLATKTFLTDWCYLNPKLPNENELCDLLVVFDEIAIIWQIKDLKLDENGKYKESAVEKNLRQLSGARRQLFELKTSIELENPRRGKEKFAPQEIKEIFLISALLGKGEEIFPFVKKLKANIVHVFTREFVQIILKEVDTISDFIDYFREKEKLIKNVRNITILGGEEDLLALYIKKGRSFKKLEKANGVLIEGGDWEDLINRKEYIDKKRADKISYYWDNIINRAHEGGQEYERIARELARPNRFQRRILSKTFAEAHVRADSEKTNNVYRRVFASDQITYCFLFLDDVAPREHRKEMLSFFCFIARGKYRQNKKVIGIATEMKIKPLCTYDFCLLEIPKWKKEHQEYAERLQKETGILTQSTRKHFGEDEYPRN